MPNGVEAAFPVHHADSWSLIIPWASLYGYNLNESFNKLSPWYSSFSELGCTGGKSKSLYGREGHLGITLIKFSSDQAGLKEANRLAEYFERDNRGRKAWARLQPLTLGSKDDENNPHLVKFDEKTREKKRILYGYVGTASDLDKLDFDTRKKVVIESQREYKSSK